MSLVVISELRSLTRKKNKAELYLINTFIIKLFNLLIYILMIICLQVINTQIEGKDNKNDFNLHFEP